MSKLNLPDIGSLANSASARQAINDNFAAIEEAFDNTLSRDGTLPNQMEADIDLNDNDLLNVRSIDAAEYLKDGIPLEQSVAYGNKLYETFDGTGAQTSFLLATHPGSLGNLEVSVNGEVLRPGLDYTSEGTTLTFLAAPAAGTDNILVRYDQALPVGIANAGAILYEIPSTSTNTSVGAYLDSLDSQEGADVIGYTPPSTSAPGTIQTFLDALWSTGINLGAKLLRWIQAGGGAVARTVEDKLREKRTPEDFGAVADGVTNDRLAILLADAVGPFRFVAGRTYLVSTSCTITQDVEFEPGAKLSIPAGQVVTFTGAINAGPYQIFSGDGTAAGFSKNWTILPEWFGADPLTVVDSIVPLQKAVTAAVGREVHLSGLYLTSGPLQVSLPVLIRGKSKTNSGIKSNSLTGNIIEVQCGAGALTGVEIRDLYIDATAAKTSGYGIAILASSGGTLFDGMIENVSMSDKMFSGLRVQSAFFLRLTDINVVKVGSNGIGFHFAGVDAISRVVNVYANRCMVRFGIAGGNTIGFLIDSHSEGFYCEACSMESAGLNYGVYIDNSLAAPRPPENLWFSKFICDNNATHGWNILAGLTVRMTDTWSTTCSSDGIHIASGTDIEIRGHTAVGNGNYGAWLQGGSQVRFLGGTFDANGQAAINTYAGIVVSAGVSDFTIKDVEFFRTGTTKSHAYDVQVLAGASDRYIIKNNRCRGYLTSPVQDGGAGASKFINENIT